MTRAALSALPARPDGGKMLRYVNPLTGGPVMTTMDLYAMRVGRGATTRPRRATYNVICLVAEGEGSSTVGDKTFNWVKHDVFTIPHWTWVSHQAKSSDADLFLVTDRSAQERLGVMRAETKD